MIRKKHILVAVLNWGLGHATRSIPVIHQLLDDQNMITLASDGAALAVLSAEFPAIPSIELPGYNVTYPSQNMAWNIGSQFPKIAKAIRSEHGVIKQYLQQNKVDIIISDNRYGCHHEGVENIFMSHQLNLQVPLSGIVNRLHAKLVNRFQQVWIVDDANRTLSGRLSETKWISNSIKVKFLGPQSRLSKVANSKAYDIAAILSGPEPQRTFLEEELVDKLEILGLKSILIQGSKSASKIESTTNVEIIPFADAERLSEVICGTEMIICRSGYSTIMDLAKLRRKVLFIPTPGQTEQIHLAERLKEQKIAPFQWQGKIDILKAWNKRTDYKGF